jgi:DNA repair protein RadC
MKVQSSNEVPYLVEHESQDEDAIIRKAFEILEGRAVRRDYFTRPIDVKDFCVMQNAKEEDDSRERFRVLFLNAQNGFLYSETLAEGTLTQCSVYPREVVRAAMKANAASVIFTHNHPSGAVEPSDADIKLTECLKKALALVDVRVLDHIIVAGDRTCSLAERGCI